ncbi:MAG: hypothetical protein ABEI13_02740, partial [Candidatus Paceibacteria bacterium]
SALLAGITLQFGLCILLCIDDPELQSELYTVLGIVIVLFVLYTSVNLIVVERQVYQYIVGHHNPSKKALQRLGLDQIFGKDKINEVKEQVKKEVFFCNIGIHEETKDFVVQQLIEDLQKSVLYIHFPRLKETLKCGDKPSNQEPSILNNNVTLGDLYQYDSVFYIILCELMKYRSSHLED